MKRQTLVSLIASLVAWWFPATVLAQPPKQLSTGHLERGYIQNWEGERCWYSQVEEPRSNYFHDRIQATVRTLTFDEPSCMSGGELEEAGIDLNKGSINGAISRPYAQPGAAFATRPEDLFATSLHQVRGRCIQSETFAAVSVAVDYDIEDGSIVRAHHAQAIGCRN